MGKSYVIIETKTSALYRMEENGLLFNVGSKSPISVVLYIGLGHSKIDADVVFAMARKRMFVQYKSHKTNPMQIVLCSIEKKRRIVPRFYITDDRNGIRSSWADGIVKITLYNEP